MGSLNGINYPPPIKPRENGRKLGPHPRVSKMSLILLQPTGAEEQNG